MGATPAASDRDAAGARLLLAGALGAAVALGLGIYANVHDPSQELVFDLIFPSTIAMKVWLASAAAALALVQVSSALWVYGRLPWKAPDWASDLHRISGRLAFLASLPVAYHCLWSLGFQDADARVLAHSLLGCAFYGAFAAKVVIVRSKRQTVDPADCCPRRGAAVRRAVRRLPHARGRRDLGPDRPAARRRRPQRRLRS